MIMEPNISDNLVDYFFICGLDANIGLDSYEMTDENDEVDASHDLPPLKRPYKPTILQKFPDHCGTYPFPEDYAITSLCMPDGLKLFSGSSLLINHPINHNFIVIREDASRIYGTALLFPEEITNEDVKLAINDLQNMFRMGNNMAISKLQTSSCSDCTCNEETNLRDSGTFSVSSSGNTDYWTEEDKLFGTKAIGILSQHAYVKCHEAWLFDIWWFVLKNQFDRLGPEPLLKGGDVEIQEQEKLSYSSDVDLDPSEIRIELKPVKKLNLESYIYNLLFEINVPNDGKIISIEGPNLKHYCRSPVKKDLPVFELPMRGLLEVLGLENLIRVFSCVLLEYRVVILSRDYRLLMLIADCVTCLLFPFVWSHVYAPILPLAARHFLNAPLPFIMGIRIGSNEEEENIQLASEERVCYVNVDKQSVRTPEGTPAFPFELELRKVITDLMVESVKDLPKNAFKSYAVNTRSSSASMSETKKNPKLSPRTVSSSNQSPFDEPIVKTNNEKAPHLTSLKSLPTSPQSDNQPITKQNSNLQTNDKLCREADISIFDFLHPIISETKLADKIEYVTISYINMLKFNNSLRELFLNHFLHIFFDYDQFIIPPKSDSSMDSYFTDRESAVQNFDKASFLSEQPETHLPFLSAFLETQMFAHFIDMKMLANWRHPHQNLHLFEKRLTHMKMNFQKQMSQYSSNEIIGMRPYRSYNKSADIIKQNAKSFKSYLLEAQTTRTEHRPHILSCNDPNSGQNTSECPSASSAVVTDPCSHTPINTVSHNRSSSFCSVHHHHHEENQPIDLENKDEALKLFTGVIFPTLQGDCLRKRPRRKSITVKPASHIHHHHHTHHHLHQKQDLDSKEHSITNSLPRGQLMEKFSMSEQKSNRSPNIRTKRSALSSHQKNRSTPDPNMIGSAAMAIDPANNNALFHPTQSRLDESPESGVINTRTISNTSVGDFNNQKENRARRDPKPYFPNIVPNVMAQNHWAFVNALLQETKAKTKRMVLEKMGGQEAQELGHGDLFVSDIEENTLVAGLCDLLERIWCHGLNHKQGKSALWTHLIKFVDRDQKKHIIKRTNKENMRLNAAAAANENNGEINSNGYIGSLKKIALNHSPASASSTLQQQPSRSCTPDSTGPRNSQKPPSSSSNTGSPFKTAPSNSSSSGGGVMSELFGNWSFGSLGRKSNTPRKSQSSSPAGNNGKLELRQIFGPERRSLLVDVKSIEKMTDIKTDVGFARAFVRLALEKKLLSEHLKKLLMDTNLLRELYKRHAFLRCEEEREQFLFHLLALQAVEYYCFTNLYIRAQLIYRVFIATGSGGINISGIGGSNNSINSMLPGSSSSQTNSSSSSRGRFARNGVNTTANVWFCINGQHCSSGQHTLPKGLLEFEFVNQNMGILTTMRIGHDNSGLSPKWFVEFVLVQNVITGHIYKFPCNHWLGKGVDDGSTERLLVGELIRFSEDDIKNNETRSSKLSLTGLQTPPRSRSPSVNRRTSDGKVIPEVAQIQEQLGNAVNNLFKYYCRLQDREKVIPIFSSIPHAASSSSSATTQSPSHMYSSTTGTQSIPSIGGSGSGGSGGGGGIGSCHVTLLLCGEYGLVNCMERVFLYGFQTSRIYQKKHFIWDYIEKTAQELSVDLQIYTSQQQGTPGLAGAGQQSRRNSKSNISNKKRDSIVLPRSSHIFEKFLGGNKEDKEDSDLQTTCVDNIRFSSNKIPSINRFCRLVDQISNISDSVGKDGKFQKFICISIREHALGDWIDIFSLTDSTQQFYSEYSFFRDPQLREFIINILSSLSEFNITLEPALIDGLV